MLNKQTLVAAAFVLNSVSASPLPGSPLTVIGLPVGSKEVCKLSLAEKSTWQNSGASVYLDKFLTDNGSSNWLNKLDQTTTQGGVAGTSNLNCIDLERDGCRQPDVFCENYTPPVVWHIRNAAHIAYGTLKTMHERLQNEVILNALNIDQMVDDFGAGFLDSPPLSTSHFLDNFGGALAAVSGLSGVVGVTGGVGGGIGFVGGVLSTAALNAVDEIADLGDFAATVKQTMKVRLGKVFEAHQAAIEEQARLLFGGEGDLSKLAGQTDENNEKNAIAKVFAGGKFVAQVTAQGVQPEVDQLFDETFKRLKQGLVGDIFKSLRYYILINTNRDQNACRKITGSRWIDGEGCATLERHDGSAEQQTTVIPVEVMLKLDNPAEGYNIDPAQMYRNAIDCQNKHPDFQGTVSDSIFAADGLPECFYSIPVIKAAGGPCTEVVLKGAKYPAELGFGRNCEGDVVFNGGN